MTLCIPFLRVTDIATTIRWYEQIGFACTGTHQEPGCDLDWAQLEYDDAVFMLYPAGRTGPAEKDAGLFFILSSIEGIAEKLRRHVVRIEETEQTEYGMKEVVFWDLNGFQVTFGCEVNKQVASPQRKAQSIIRCKDMARTLEFYISVLDFNLKYSGTTAEDPVVTIKNGDVEIVFCTFDGASRIPINIRIEEDIDELFKKYVSRGLVTPGNPNSPVHEGPLDQSWGTREFYVNDPDGNTLRFLQQPIKKNGK